MTPVEARVAAGAAWYDRELPGWAELVDLDSLNLSEPCGCVIGQIVQAKAKDETAVYEAAVEWEAFDIQGEWEDPYQFWVDGFMPGHDPLSREAQRNLGFLHHQDSEFDGPSAEYQALTAAWRVEIAARL